MSAGDPAEDWRAEASGRLASVVSELDSFRSNLRTWIAEVRGVDVTGTAERGRVVARCSGYGELRSIDIEPAFFAEATTRRLESAINAAVLEAERRAREELASRQSQLKIFGMSVGDGLAGKPLTELLPPMPTPGTPAGGGS